MPIGVRGGTLTRGRNDSGSWWWSAGAGADSGQPQPGDHGVLCHDARVPTSLPCPRSPRLAMLCRRGRPCCPRSWSAKAQLKAGWGLAHIGGLKSRVIPVCFLPSPRGLVKRRVNAPSASTRKSQSSTAERGLRRKEQSTNPDCTVVSHLDTPGLRPSHI